MIFHIFEDDVFLALQDIHDHIVGQTAEALILPSGTNNGLKNIEHVGWHINQNMCSIGAQEFYDMYWFDKSGRT